MGDSEALEDAALAVANVDARNESRLRNIAHGKMSMRTSQVKSKERVAKHGEVFTAEREVKAMCDLVKNETERIDSRFLEPACGDGNFLAEILTRKLDDVTRRYKGDPVSWERNALIALGSLYGVDILDDNIHLCRTRLYGIFEDAYKLGVKKRERSDEVYVAARLILTRNILCGNALTLKRVDENGNETDQPIIFTKWAFTTGSMIKRSEFTFAELLEKNEPPKPKKMQEDDLFASVEAESDGEGTLVKEYPPIHYKRLMEQENNNG